MEQISITRQLFTAMYQACNQEQLEVLIDSVDLKNGLITKEGVLKLHDIACDEWKKKLLINFPSAIENIAIVKPADNATKANALCSQLCKELGIDGYAMQMIHDSATQESYKYRAFVVSQAYTVEVNKCTNGKTEIVLKHK